MFGEEKFKFQAGEHEAAEEAGDEQEGQHGGEDEEKKVVGGEEGTGTGGGEGKRKEDAGACDAIADAAAQECGECFQLHNAHDIADGKRRLMVSAG